MFVTKKHPNGGAPLKTFPMTVDPASGNLGYKVGYCACGCREPLLIRTIDVREIVDTFGLSQDIYQRNVVDKLKSIFN